MMKRILLAMTCLIAIPLTQAMAAGMAVKSEGACYTKAEAEAEQAIRIHSELMVIGLNCQNSRYNGGGENLYVSYRQFTADHARVISGYETQLIDYYKRTGSKRPEADFNTLRTTIANKIALDAAKMRPDQFCYQYSPRIKKVKAMSEDDFHQWAAASYKGHPASHPLCK
jgi:hypothetical protein